ncbi:MAG: PQQ-dependent sugar dehydrogenase [Luteolibacter sp.]|uniref:PQQ-dependent sugar dehydrogenase n=1 Tax=Luteolibacter sp. TaxID=1962973 RepID=UPI00326791A7
MSKRPSILRLSLIFLLGWIGCHGISNAAVEPNWPIIGFAPIISGVENTVDIQNAADGSNRLFLVRQNGIIRILKNGALLPTPLLDVSGKIALNGEQGEQGLLGLAFPPGFAQKKCFYVYYCRSGDGATVVSRFRMSTDPNVALPNSEEILLVTPKQETNHNGGQLAFGPDGLLYISIGDGGGAGDPDHNSQNLANRLGKILRIHVDQNSPGLPYGIPAANPFATSTTRRPEILCWGLRNPWRFSFDPLTGDLFIGDVGEQQREEINFLPFASFNAGTNFGWSVKEGTLDFVAQTGTVGSLRPPAFEYDHSLGSSVTGGYIYRGTNPRLQGLYLFGDFQTGRIWAMESPAAGGRVSLLKDTDYHPSTFGKDEAGEIYFADYYGSSVYRIDAPDTLPPPTIYPPTGTFTDSVSFYLSTNVPGAVVRYTTDGSAPDADSLIFNSNAIQSFDPLTVRAATFRADMNPSPPGEAIYQLRPNYVAIGGGNGFFNDYTTCFLSTSTSGTEIRYTINGSQPTATSPLYSAQTGVFIDHTLVLKAVAIKPGDGWQPSEVTSHNFNLFVTAPTLSAAYVDLYSPVQLVNQTPGTTIRYTTNRTLPTEQSPIWTGPLNVPEGTEINVLATKNGMNPATARLIVTKISAQKTRFEKSAANPDGQLYDIVRVNDSLTYAVSYGSLWKLEGGAWTRLYQSALAQHYVAVGLASDGKVAAAYSANTYGGIELFTPSGTQLQNWFMNYVTPSDLLPLPAGGFLVADSTSDKILKITGPNAITPLPPYDIPPTTGNFDLRAMTRDGNGRILVATDDARIRRIGPDNVLSPVAGGLTGWDDGPLSSARFQQAQEICCDQIGNIYVADVRNYTDGRIRKIRPDGTVTTLWGSVFQTGTSIVLAPDSFGPSNPVGLDVDQNGVLYIAGDSTITRAIQEDWDNDGIPDTTEVTLGAPFVVGIDDRLADADGDLFSNAAEWIAGTNALLSTSYPTERTQIQLKDGTVSLNLPCEPGMTNQLEYSDDLQNWKPMGAPSTSAFRSFAARFVVPQPTTQRFYRLKSTP